MAKIPRHGPSEATARLGHRPWSPPGQSFPLSTACRTPRGLASIASLRSSVPATVELTLQGHPTPQRDAPWPWSWQHPPGELGSRAPCRFREGASPEPTESSALRLGSPPFGIVLNLYLCPPHDDLFKDRIHVGLTQATPTAGPHGMWCVRVLDMRELNFITFHFFQANGQKRTS